MKILHVVHGLAPDIGGPGMIAVHLAAAQAGLGNDVTVLGNYESRDQIDFSLSHGKTPHFEKIRIRNTEDLSLREHLVPLKGVQCCKQLIDRDTLVHLHGVWEPLLLFAAKLAWSRSARYVVSPHSMLHPWQMQRYRLPKQALLALAWRRLLRRAFFVQANTVPEVDFVLAVEPAARTEVIPNGVSLEQFGSIAGADSFWNRYPHLKAKPYLLFLARLHYQKGLRHLVDAFKIVAAWREDIQLVVAGPDRGERERFERRVADAGLSDRVHLVGPLYGRDKVLALQSAACFCLPSLNEGCSLSILEALASKVPVVITEGCMFPEVEQANAGLVVSLQPDAIAKAMITILGDDALRQRMSTEAHRLVEQSYSWTRIAGMTLQAYQRFDTRPLNG